MPKSSKPRKKHRPRAVLANANARAMNAVTLLTPEEREQCAQAPEKALQAFVDGEDPAFQWAVMADALNVAEALSDVGICSDLASRDKITQGQRALTALHGATSTCGDDVCWLADIAEAIEMHRIQLSLCDYSEYRRAVDTVIRKVQGARAGNAAPGTTILEASPATAMLEAAAKVLDAAPVPTDGRMRWNPATNEVEPLP